MPVEEFECTPEQTTGCFGIQIFSNAGCPAGATITLDVYNEDVDPELLIGQATGITLPIDPGGTQQAVIGDTTGFEGTASAQISTITC